MELIGYTSNFEASRKGHWWFVGRSAVLETVLARLGLVPGRSRILDYGAGTGANVPLFSRYGAVVGVEPSDEARALAAKDGIYLLKPDSLPESERFDLVAACDVIEHVDDDVAMLRDFRGRLSPGGRVLVTVPAYPWLWSYNDWLAQHKRRYTPRTLRERFAEAGLEVEWLSYWNALLLPLVAAAAVRDYRRSRRERAGTAADENPYLSPVPGPLDLALRALMGVELPLLRRGARLPFGVSLIALARPRE